MRRAEFGIQQAQELPYFRNCTDRGFTAAPATVLLDGHRGGQPRQSVDVGGLHLLGKLAGVGAHHVHKTLLTFRKNNIEREGTLTAAGEARNNGHFVTVDVHINIFEVVVACPAQGNHSRGYVVLALRGEQTGVIVSPFERG